ncbi:hypothetical protein OFO10_06025 [Campylobacter sp. VBCF_06 NA8]|uniref:hypothetical protein n=1 Tax=Campylobacter sp. VBCF_06 NA8 TaxID=2983822 RepID=UPI0022E9C1E6|nr:hypothetical protein [Campylobacter sp. VBCF_06 NA8]MDA3046712.1 hypothetical protein [Campylobacter sp. VBCF_06 NA8]
MIKTEYKISLEIDSDMFSLVVKEPNLTERKDLELKAENQKAKIRELENKAKEQSDINLRLNELNETIQINKELIKNCDIKDKISLLFENKKLVKEKTELCKKLGEFSADEIAKSLNDDLESLFAYKIDLLVLGDDKERFKNTLKDKGLSSRIVWEAINEAIKEAQAKK